MAICLPSVSYTHLSNNFQEYSQYLRENHNVAIIKWDDIKQGNNKNEGYKEGFTVIDLENKIAYKGEDLYRYDYEQNQTLDGKGSYVDIDWNKFNEVGVKPENLSPEDIANIKNCLLYTSILPLMQVNKNLVFKKNYRNIFVFEKFTFPDEKVLTIETVSYTHLDVYKRQL